MSNIALVAHGDAQHIERIVCVHRQFARYVKKLANDVVSAATHLLGSTRPTNLSARQENYGHGFTHILVRYASAVSSNFLKDVGLLQHFPSLEEEGKRELNADGGTEDHEQTIESLRKKVKEQAQTIERLRMRLARRDGTINELGKQYRMALLQLQKEEKRVAASMSTAPLAPAGGNEKHTQTELDTPPKDAELESHIKDAMQQQLLSEKNKSKELEAALQSKSNELDQMLRSQQSDECIMQELQIELAQLRKKSKIVKKLKGLLNLRDREIRELRTRDEERDDQVESLKARVATLKEEKKASAACRNCTCESVGEKADVAYTANSDIESDSSSCNDTRDSSSFGYFHQDASANVDISADDVTSSVNGEDDEGDDDKKEDEAGDSFPPDIHRNLPDLRERLEREGKEFTIWEGTNMNWEAIKIIFPFVMDWVAEEKKNGRPNRRKKNLQASFLAILSFFITFGIGSVPAAFAMTSDEYAKVIKTIDAIAGEIESSGCNFTVYKNPHLLAAAAKGIAQGIGNVFKNKKAQGVDSDSQQKLYERIYFRVGKGEEGD